MFRSSKDRSRQVFGSNHGGDPGPLKAAIAHSHAVEENRPTEITWDHDPKWKITHIFDWSYKKRLPLFVANITAIFDWIANLWLDPKARFFQIGKEFQGLEGCRGFRSHCFNLGFGGLGDTTNTAVAFKLSVLPFSLLPRKTIGTNLSGSILQQIMEPKLELIGQLSSRSKRSAVAATVAMGFPHLSLTCFPPVTGTFKCNPPIRKCDFRPYIRDIQILYIYI